MKQTIVRSLAAAALLLAASCSREPDSTGPAASEELATARITLGLEGAVQTRGDRLDDGSYNESPRISDGTRATTLIYALYNSKGEPVQIKNPNYGKDPDAPETVQQARLTGVHFPYGDDDDEALEFSLVKGLDYTLVFWAQSENGDDFYNTADLRDIQVYYDQNNQNNEEARDAFCVSRPLTITQDEFNISLVLRRPFAQINVGFPKEDYTTLESDGFRVVTSAISLLDVGNHFDLVTNKVLATEQAAIGFTANTIPHAMELGGKPIENPYLDIDINYDSNITTLESFVWVSMCYVLVPNYANNGTEEGDSFVYSSLVHIPELTFNFNDEAPFSPLVFKEINNIPVQANHRTNIIFKDVFSFKASFEVDIDAPFAGDYLSGRDTQN